MVRRVEDNALAIACDATSVYDTPEEKIALDNIQGNILGGFNKPFQAFLFFQFTPCYRRPCDWLAEIVNEVATSEEVVAFNKLYKALSKRRKSKPDILKATWMNITFTYRGLQALVGHRVNLEGFPEDFKQGMKVRAGEVGYVHGRNHPDYWFRPFNQETYDNVHALLIIASDTLQDLEHEVLRQERRIPASGVRHLFTQFGEARQDQPGHEHFGFRDGISQPRIYGLDGHPGDQSKHSNNLVWAGEFVLGYPTQQSAAPDQPGPNSICKPDWTKDGSYLVYLRLQQDVEAFRDFTSSPEVRDAGWDPEQVSATFVGRHASGWPLDQPLDRSWSGIRGGDSPDDHPINDIHFVKKDPKGKQIPSFAHIRKANTRDMPIGRERRAEAQTHRLLRRGLPYGPPFVEGAPQGSPGQADPAFPNDRGLLFLCYQRSIQNQFEYVQKGLNDPNFPTDGAGVDPIAGQQKSSGSKLKLSNTFQVTVQPWVTVTGGDYFFAPSISALRTLSNREGR